MTLDGHAFYDAWEAEWPARGATAYGRLQAVIHTDFIQQTQQRQNA
jgi:hypothetical protein